MSLWTGIALLQSVALPGLLLVRCLRLDAESRIQTAALCFGASLLLNHLLVLLLVGLGRFERPVLAAIVALELVALAALRMRRPPRPAPLGAQLRAYLEGDRNVQGDRNAPGLLRLGLCVAAAVVLVWLVARLPAGFTQIFTLWDTIQSWNRWALDWESGMVALWMKHYPQLVPTNWALLYRIQGEPFEPLAHGLMGLFPLGVAALLFDLGLRRRDAGAHLAVVVATLLFATVLGRWMVSGHVDVPVAFFGLLALHPLLVRDPADGSPPTPRHLAACALMAGAAGLTKQPGLFVVAVLPLFVWRLLPGVEWRRRALTALAPAAGAFLLAAPWYAFVELRIARGLEGRQWDAIAEHHHRALESGPLALLEPFRSALPDGLVLVLGLLALVSLARTTGRWITLAVVLPLLALWATNAAYDARNAALALPFLGLSVGHGACVVHGWIAGPGHRARRGAADAALALLALALLLPLARLDWPGLAGPVREQWLRHGDPAFNRALLAYDREHGLDGKILSDDYYLLTLPELRARFFEDPRARSRPFWLPQSTPEEFAATLETPENDIRWVLITRPHPPGILGYLQRGLATGHLEIVLSGERARLLRVHEPASRDDGADG